MVMRTASRMGMSGVVLGWQYSAHILLRLVTLIHNSRPVSSYSWEKKEIKKMYLLFNPRHNTFSRFGTRPHFEIMVIVKVDTINDNVVTSGRTIS